ncbi:MAG: nitrate reductase associated protein [Cystobacterineae bacterium]|nr:nitrate reductase associated protein [Cystobacterineae bacterium]
MYKFGFETEIDVHLGLMPLGVRRKLDIAGLKLPLESWQALRFEERCRLCEEEPDTLGVEAYAALVRLLVEGRPGQWVALPALPSPRPWATQEARARIEARSEAAGRPLSAEAWEALGDEQRYVLWRLSEPGRGVQKLLAALEEFL